MPKPLKITEISAADLAEKLGVTEQRIGQLVKAGHVVRLARGKYDLWASILAYVVFLRAGAAGNGACGNTSEEQAIADLRFSRARAEIYENRAELVAGRAFDADAVMAVGSDMISAFRSRCLAIPTRYAAVIQLAGVEDLNIVQKILKDAIYEALQELSMWDPSAIVAKFAEAGGEGPDPSRLAAGDRELVSEPAPPA